MSALPIPSLRAMDSWTFPDLLQAMPNHCAPLLSSSSTSSSSSSASAWLDNILPQPWMDSVPLPQSACQTNIAIARSSPAQEPRPVKAARRRNTKKRTVNDDPIVNSNYDNISSEKYRTSACRVVSERQRRKILGDSILALKALLPLNQSKQIDKCSILKEAGKHILTLKEEMQDLVKKKEELATKKAGVITKNGGDLMKDKETSSVTVDNGNIDVEEKERVTLHYCNASNVFVTMRIPGTGTEMRLSTVLTALQMANVDIINVVTSWTEDNRSFRLMAHAKKIGDAASAQALKEDLLRIAYRR